MVLDAVALEVARHALAGIAEEMGTALRRAAYSPNIKERLDLSAAVFGPDRQMVAQAEHIPVHLGSMPAAVEAVLDTLDLRPGMQALVNDPYAGGSHLPDLTLVAAVGDADGRLLGYVANRAHHADIAGSAPGSMAADATDIAMEGLRVPPLLLVDDRGLREDVVAMVAANSRTPRERHGDLRAQMAATHVGAERLRELAARTGTDRLHEAMAAVCDYAERRVRASLAALPDGVWHFTDLLELDPALTPDGDGAVPISVEVRLDGECLVADFAGTAAQVPANVNAVRAVTESAALFVLRVLTDPDAPANAGTARCLDVRTPRASLVDAVFPAPVATGNVETSQRIVDVLFGALAEAAPDRVPAASQGTMNNVLIGASPVGVTDGAPGVFSYYETIGGGEGATPWRDGMSAIHTAMTNTRNTPVEALELAYPLRVHQARLRRGSGGAGRFRGGDGLVREIELLQPATVTVQAERHARGPWGLAGGAPGAPGRATLVHADGREERLPAKFTRTLAAGQRLRIETPGGGGWGSPPGP